MRILFIIPSFLNGGATTCLRNLVSKLDKNLYEIEVFAITNEGPNKEYIAKHCTILNANGKSCMNVASNPRNMSSNKDIAIRRIAFGVKALKKKLAGIGIDISPIVFRLVAKKLESNNYDLVIAFQEGLASLLGSFFSHTPKVAWVHCDYKAYLEIKDVNEIKRYSGFSKIICVSEFTRRQFLDIYPKFEDKTIALHNIIDDKMVISMSKEKYVIPFETLEFTIVSVGRMADVKRFDLIPELASKVKSSGLKFKWYILGGGNETITLKIKHNIRKYKVEDEVILSGEVNNPYPYIANANLLVSTSKSEACPCVFSEAFILNTPILSANFGSASEFIDHGVNGWISPIENMADNLIHILNCEDEYIRINNNISTYRFDNNSLLVQFDQIVSKS